MSGLSWPWIALMVTVPSLVGVLVAFPFWRYNETILGNLAGAAVIFAAALALIFREHSELDRLNRQCLDSGFVCWPSPSAFARYAIYSCIGLVEVFGVFIFSLTIEKKIRNRHYAPEWR